MSTIRVWSFTYNHILCEIHVVNCIRNLENSNTSLFLNLLEQNILYRSPFGAFLQTSKPSLVPIFDPLRPSLEYFLCNRFSIKKLYIFAMSCAYIFKNDWIDWSSRLRFRSKGEGFCFDSPPLSCPYHFQQIHQCLPI